MIEAVLFYIIAAVALVSAFAVVTRKSAMVSAVWLILCLLSVAVIFALLSAGFVAVLQVLISAGAVMVLVVFVVMLVDSGNDMARERIVSFSKALGAIAAAYLGLVLIIAIARPPALELPQSGEAYESPASIAGVLFSQFLVPFELVGVVLFIACVGAIILAKGRRAAAPSIEGEDE